MLAFGQNKLNKRVFKDPWRYSCLFGTQTYALFKLSLINNTLTNVMYLWLSASIHAHTLRPNQNLPPAALAVLGDQPRIQHGGRYENGLFLIFHALSVYHMQRLYLYTMDRPNNAFNLYHHSQLVTHIAYLWKKPHYGLDCFFKLAGCKSGGGLGGGNIKLPGDLSSSKEIQDKCFFRDVFSCFVAEHSTLWFWNGNGWF